MTWDQFLDIFKDENMSIELHRRIPYVSDLGLGPRAIVVNYLVQGALGLLLGSILSFHFAPPRDNPNMVLKARAILSIVNVKVLAQGGSSSQKVRLVYCDMGSQRVDRYTDYPTPKQDNGTSQISVKITRLSKQIDGPSCSPVTRDTFTSQSNK